MKFAVRCPKCDSEAVNKYGKTSTGKQRFICLICGRQFISGCPRQRIENRPLCPICGEKMHVYRIEKDCIRFRCSTYPKCRGFAKVLKEGAEHVT